MILKWNFNYERTQLTFVEDFCQMCFVFYLDQLERPTHVCIVAIHGIRHNLANLDQITEHYWNFETSLAHNTVESYILKT